MRAILLGLAVLLAPLGGCASTLVEMPQPTNVAFAASDPNGMLVLSQNGGTSYAVGRYRFVRVDRETRRLLQSVDVRVGAGQGQRLLGQRPGAIEATNTFHYALVPPGDYALIYMDSTANNTVTITDRWTCLRSEAPIYTVNAGAITVVRVPDRIQYDIVRDNRIVQRAVLRRMPAGTTLEYLRSDEKALLDFSEIVATNTLLTAPYALVAASGAMTFEAPDRADASECDPTEATSIAVAP